MTRMHQIRFQLGLRPRPCWGAYSTPQHPPAGFKGPTSKGRKEMARKGQGLTHCYSTKLACHRPTCAKLQKPCKKRV